MVKELVCRLRVLGSAIYVHDLTGLISCVFMCTLSLFYILAIAVLYFKERYTVEAISIKLNIYENNY